MEHLAKFWRGKLCGVCGHKKHGGRKVCGHIEGGYARFGENGGKPCECRARR